MMAIEQFDELESRHAFLTTQRKDLVDSIAQTSEAIKRIDETTRQRFAEAFAAINQNFQEIFSTLFGGGRAGLTLLDENDPLESGIEIIAQPPGKRLQSVQLLSGGEKALTAIALMFGLFKFKPSPFCLLDEIDAPLDDANIGRFVEMLRSMQQPHAVHPHHPQPQDHGDRRPPLRRHDGGAGRLEADLGAVELTGPAPRMYHGRLSMDLRVRGRAIPLVVAALALAFASAGCMNMGPLVGKATDEWTKTYPLPAGGEVRIDNSNGKIEIEGVDGSTVEVHALKIAHAATDEGARQLLPRISIKEEITANRVSILTERMEGVMIGARVEVEYHVKAPKGAVINAMASNGTVTLRDLSGQVSARTSNGGITGTDLTGAVEARTTNGQVSVELASLGKDKISLGTTNGAVSLTLPEAAKADLSATVTNGSISVTGLKLETTEENRRHVEGKLNGGGTAIELRTTNGSIRVRAR